MERVLFNAQEHAANAHYQIWQVAYKTGEAQRVTNDLISYRMFSLTANSDGLAVIQGEAEANTRSGDNILRKVAIDGGQPVQLTNFPSGRPVVSPDGKQIACTYQENRDAPVKIAVISFEGGSPLKTFPLLSDVEATAVIIRWTADGREIVYPRTINGVSNLWAQPVDGGQPRQMTYFTSDRIFWFDFSRDGKQLALSRGTLTGDIVLIRDFG
ncbi:MAG TPA: hypothetical protein VD835_00955 [Pyrinomonadaceae bacterium]|nr:hypothetical protein [Pyrinomonadaceae bacterium]